ncbi:MAG: hypothetical protein KC910_03590 [Candidatus Eremiobacteraeota bacterium]|nr:hypothetical protein [Candidatus Eremiobacteraeota bacterium]
MLVLLDSNRQTRALLRALIERGHITARQFRLYLGSEGASELAKLNGGLWPPRLLGRDTPEAGVAEGRIGLALRPAGRVARHGVLTTLREFGLCDEPACGLISRRTGTNVCS